MSLIRRADSQAREYTDRAIAKLAEIMENGEDRDAIRAADVLLDRGHAKAVTATIALPANREQAAMLASMSDEELMARIRGPARLSRDPVIEVDTGPDPLLL